jgi:hypothetical protein
MASLETLIKNSQIDHKNNILKKYFKNKDVIYTKEILDHDGFDQFGPESDLWTLYIIIKDNNNYILYRYYYEDWYTMQNLNFDIDNDSLYEFERMDILSKIQKYDFFKLYQYRNEINNNEIKKILEYIYEKVS